MELAYQSFVRFVIWKRASDETIPRMQPLGGAVTILAYPFGNGDGSTTFGIPDRRGRSLHGRDNMGPAGSSAAGVGGRVAAHGDRVRRDRRNRQVGDARRGAFHGSACRKRSSG